MANVGIAPAAIKRWRKELEAFAGAAISAELHDMDRYPAETAHEIEGGCLLLCVQFPSGDEVSMKIAPEEWRWARGSVH